MTYLELKNLKLNNKRTTVRMEPEIWDSLNNICQLENVSLTTLATLINDSKKSHQTLSSAIRVFVMRYYQGKYERSSDISINDNILKAS